MTRCLVFEFAIFAVVGAALVAAGVEIAIVVATHKRNKRAREFPIALNRGVRSTAWPKTLSRIDIEAQLDELVEAWPVGMKVLGKLDGLNIRWTYDDHKTTQPFYDPIKQTAHIPAGGATRVWQTGLAHEAAHHIMRPRADHPAAIFSEALGAVRLAREAIGMHKYPRGK